MSFVRYSNDWKLTKKKEDRIMTHNIDTDTIREQTTVSSLYWSLGHSFFCRFFFCSFFFCFAVGTIIASYAMFTNQASGRAIFFGPRRIVPRAFGLKVNMRKLAALWCRAVFVHLWSYSVVSAEIVVRELETFVWEVFCVRSYSTAYLQGNKWKLEISNLSEVCVNVVNRTLD